MARSAGASVQLVSREGGNALLKLPSGEIRRVMIGCMATIGQWAIWIMRTKRLGKPAVRDGWASARTIAA